MSDEPSHRTLAEIGNVLGDSDGHLFSTALRAMGGAPQDIGTDEWEEFVAAQVYAAAFVERPQLALDFVEVMTDVYEIDDLSDVNDILGRESFERQQYEGQLAFVESHDE